MSDIQSEKKFAKKLKKKLRRQGMGKKVRVYTHREEDWYSAFDVRVQYLNTTAEDLPIEVKVRNKNHFEYDFSGYRKFKYDGFFLNTEKVKRSIAFGKDITVVWINEDMDSIYFLPKMSAIYQINPKIEEKNERGIKEERFVIPKETVIYGWPMFIDFVTRPLNNRKQFPRWEQK
jgi:hypothetical protein